MSPGGPERTIGPGDRVLVTGGTGFIGSAVVRALVERRAEVLATVQPGADRMNLAGLDVDTVEADLRDGPAIAAAARDCRYVFHVAAVYRFWSPRPDEFYDVNVGGTLNVLDAAARAGVERVVYTSTVGTIGLDHSGSNGHGAGREPASEGHWPRVEHLFGHYKRSKYVAEHEVLRAAAEGLPAVLVQPTLPIGPGDHGPTPTGRIVLDFLNGRMPAYVDTAMNAVDVDDVAAGHLLAAERGRQGRSYVLGGENLSFRELLSLLASVTGLPAPWLRVPARVTLAAAHVSEIVEGRLVKRHPTVPLEAVRMATTRMVYDDSRAREELGYRSRPARQALARSARWFAENGYVDERRLRKLRWAD
ncbi:MAG TPA: hopanoid-associated sugar epimerase [Acidimicrobiales bacterium]|nr:hopanoid-associated sugar epimerase [Acidimicrobiales bacterium]